MTRGFSTSILAAGALALLAGVPLTGQGADLENGEKVYRKCKTCHALDQEKNKVGPHLVGIFGRRAGSVEGFKYSNAMTESGVIWDEKTIAEYLERPKDFIPGNRMTFPGLKEATDREDVIAYIKANAEK